MKLIRSSFILVALILQCPLIFCQQLEEKFSLPSCGISTTITTQKKRPRIAFVSHDSAMATFFHNPEQGSRDAANMVDVDVEWNRYLTASESTMVKDIRNAVDNV
jgi:hypothetical protein